MGEYYFEAGSSAQNGAVLVTNQSATAGNSVVADAVRFGGGMGEYNPGSGTSGRPRFEESGQYHSGFMGKSYTDGRVASMPLYAAWECEAWEAGRSVYVSWHNNAAGGTGTETYSAGTSGVAGSDQLRNAIHAELINDLRAGWNSGWVDRGTKTSAFTEIAASNNPDMPAALLELAFFDRAEDAAALKQPEFQRIAARAVYQGIVKFYNSYYPSTFPSAALLPEPPVNPRAIHAGAPGQITLTWSEPPWNTGNNFHGDRATSYKVYRSTNGKGFDNGTATAQTSLTVTGLTPGQTYYFRVTALNAGGESFPTETLAARVPPADAPSGRLLIVNGFDRLDSAMDVLETDPQSGLPVPRFFLDRMNSYDYVIAHARALAAATRRGFDSSSNEAVASGAVALANYAAVIWILGEESTADKTFDANERARVEAYLAAGGNLFVSGAEIAYELDSQNAARAFYNSTLRAAYVADSATGNRATGAAGSIFEGLEVTFDTSGASVYKVESADVIAASGGSIEALTYGGAGGAVTIEDFDDLAGWWQPSGASQTNADATSSFLVDSSVVQEGAASGRLYYVWGTGNYIRVYNSAQTEFAAASTLSMWVYGDASGNELRFSIRDSDGDLFANAWTAVNWSGWRKIAWDLANDTRERWAGAGDGAITGPNVKFDSLLFRKVGAAASGSVYFDLAEYSTAGGGSGGSGAAAIQYAGASKVVCLAFPFETILSEGQREDLMARVLAFFFGAPGPNGAGWMFY